MKRFIYSLLIIFSFSNCEDVVEIDVPEGTPRLIIDASFEFYLSESPQSIEGFVRLSESSPFFDEDIPAVNDATVFIKNLSDNTVIDFENINANGVYIPNNTNINELIPDFDIDYQLTVIHNGETYTAVNRLYPSVPIDNIEQGDDTLFDEDETEVIITFTDDGSRDDFYLFDFDLNLIEVSEDRFYQGQEFSFSYFYEEMAVGQDITIKILGISERYHDYAEQVIELSDQDSGGPFQVPPSITRGNIINTTNSDNFPLGYFNLSEAYRFDFTIQEN